MIINGVEVQQYQLSYDKIIKNTLEQSDELTIRFINGLFNDDIPLDAPVEWLDKESVSDEYKAIVADFYPRINGRMYSIEVEQADKGDMALRVFKYALGGALHHNMTATDSELKIIFPQPCVVFLTSKANTPQGLTWNIEFFDGQRVSLKIPTIRLSELSVEEIARRNLFPIGQFYLRTFEPLTERKVEDFRAAAASLLTELESAVENKLIPYHIGEQIQDIIRMTAENTIYKSNQEVDLTMTTNIIETLPWTDYREVYKKLDEEIKAESKAEGILEGRTEGIIEGKTEGITEAQTAIALKAFTRLGQGKDPTVIVRMLKDLEIPDNIIEAAKSESERARQSKNRSELER